MNTAKFLRTPILKNICEQLLLDTFQKKKKLRLKTKKHEYVMSQTERTGTKNKNLGLKKRNTLVFSVFKSKYDKERTRKTPNTYTFLAVQKLREFSLEKKI